jgi:tol-pal system protein YbgF
MDKHISIISILLAMIFLTGCALQRDVVTLDDRLAQAEKRYSDSEHKNKALEARLDEYRKANEQYDKELRSRSAGQNADIDQIQEEIRTLRGKLEETDHLLQQRISASDELNEKRDKKLESLDKATTTNNDRIARLEQYLNFESSASGEKKKTVSGTTTGKQVKHKLSEDEAYLAAKRAYDKNDFDAAREGFQKFIKAYPRSMIADNAQFWIGETYYREKWYEKAILEYQKVIEKYPKGNKVTASLLKQGFAFLNLGDKVNGRLILSELIKKYPKSNEAKIAERKLKGMTP